MHNARTAVDTYDRKMGPKIVARSVTAADVESARATMQAADAKRARRNAQTRSGGGEGGWVMAKFGTNEDGTPRAKPVLCRNCEFSTLDSDYSPECWHPDLVFTDLIVGEKPADCRRERDGSGRCGGEGKLFKQYVPGPFAAAVSEFLHAIVVGKTKESV
jgi:hypothetical protein